MEKQARFVERLHAWSGREPVGYRGHKPNTPTPFGGCWQMHFNGFSPKPLYSLCTFICSNRFFFAAFLDQIKTQRKEFLKAQWRRVVQGVQKGLCWVECCRRRFIGAGCANSPVDTCSPKMNSENFTFWVRFPVGYITLSQKHQIFLTNSLMPSRVSSLCFLFRFSAFSHFLSLLAQMLSAQRLANSCSSICYQVQR